VKDDDDDNDGDAHDDVSIMLTWKSSTGTGPLGGNTLGGSMGLFLQQEPRKGGLLQGL
jgi:hypothetical protein